MKIIINTSCILILILGIPVSSIAGELSKSLRSAAGQDTIRNVWVFFKDRPSRGGIVPVSDNAALRRARAGYRHGDGDRPVNPNYIREIERMGGKLRRTFDWENAASFSVHSSLLDNLSKLHFVKSISPVAVYVRKELDKTGLRKAAAMSDGGYEWHMEMVNIPLAHEYIKSKKIGDPGHGVYMAFFDTEFEIGRHIAFAHVRDNNLVDATYSFVNNAVPVNNGHTHGAQCLAPVAARHPDTYIGAAWGARFALAHTEDAAVEARIEEDNWARAVVWAEGLGARVISSSLGYREGYDNPGENYGYNDMDGEATVISLAAKGAIERGVIVVNSMGNEGWNVGSLTAPADVEGVVSVGAVDASRGLATFSSVGPTFDGRVKPELVAPGQAVRTVDPNSESGYVLQSGTSFSAPIVSGIMALILQTHPDITPDSARARLYESCALTPFQSQFDNRYGRGIPDAVRAVMGKDEIFLKLLDSEGTPLQGAQARIGAEAYIADEFGGVIARVQKPPETVTISFRGQTLRVLAVDAQDLPMAQTVSFDILSIKNRGGGLKIVPSVVRRNGVIRGRYYFSPSTVPRSANVTIQTVNGRTIWNHPLRIMPDGSAAFEWTPKRVAAGMYLLTIKHGGNRISQKFIVSN